MSQWPLALLAALCGTVVLAAGLGSPIENTRAPIEESRATSVTARAERVDAPQATAPGEDVVTDIGSGGASLSDPPQMPPLDAPPVRIAPLSGPHPVQTEAKEPASAVEVADIGRGGATLLDPDPKPKPTVPTAAEPVDRREQPLKPKKISVKEKPKKLTAKPRFVERRPYYSYSMRAARRYR